MEDYKLRMIEEYRQLKDKRDKLENILVKNIAGTLGFELNCPAELLEEQEKYMDLYLRCLSVRAEIEGINLMEE